MARLVHKYFLLVLFLSCVIFVSSIQARQLNVLEDVFNCDDGNVIYEFTNNLDLGAIKKSGPSPRGIGHLSVATNTIGGKKSGPSPGIGHSYINGIGGKKNSGPSPGKGH
ncbi:hypothetical protein MKW94_016854 [Papaver nudicaule]|uniref:Uncharacterized protein n=1 Tax=Papaver nudicaule TaxID=74823 RepID=A0AA41VTV1_PAPNU|nr:hypothetical protein [Papaver nudicaule]